MSLYSSKIILACILYQNQENLRHQYGFNENKYSYYSLKYHPFLSKHLSKKKKKNQQSQQLVSQSRRKDIPNKHLSKKTTNIHLKSYIAFLPQLLLSKFHMDFQKVRAKWQHSMVNHQRLTHG